MSEKFKEAAKNKDIMNEVEKLQPMKYSSGNWIFLNKKRKVVKIGIIV